MRREEDFLRRGEALRTVVDGVLWYYCRGKGGEDKAVDLGLAVGGEMSAFVGSGVGGRSASLQVCTCHWRGRGLDM